jgi:GTP-binding protein Era
VSVSLSRLERQLGYTFKDQELMVLALTHRSFAGRNNERLEFLGDAILNFVAGEALFERFPLAREGQLSRLRARLVKGETLAVLARGFDLGEYLRLGSGELKSGGFRRESILADALEALIGAIYLDAGMEMARERVLAWLAGEFEGLTLVDTNKDPKTRLQEFLQSRGCELPRYEVVDIQGEPHCRTFFVECEIILLNEKSRGQGVSRRIAEQVAAAAALIALGVENGTDTNATRCGYVAIVGRPNVGKSTLLNHILGQKLAITSRKPQTTRHNMLGIKTEGDVQAIYVDTPGMHKGGEKALNRYMNKTASAALKDVDVVIFVVDRTKWTDEDQMVLERVQYVTGPLIVALNKTDRIEDKAELMPHLSWLQEQLPNAQIIPISAQHGHNLDALERVIAEHLPENDHFFPEDQITDRSSRFLAAELVREKIMRQMGAELPYQITVEIEEFKQHGAAVRLQDHAQPVGQG